MAHKSLLQTIVLFGSGGLFVLLGSQSADAAPALKPSVKELNRKLQLDRVQEVKAQLAGGFERVKIGKDLLSDYLDLLDKLGRAMQNLGQSPDERIDAALSMLRQLTIVEMQIRDLQTVGLQPQAAVKQAEASRQRAADLLKSLTGDP